MIKSALKSRCRLLSGGFLLAVVSVSAMAAAWRPATSDELTTALPARAPVVSERIETELRSASGVIDEHGHIIAGVVLITAGYSANGKYSDYLLTQVPIEIGGATLPPGGYLIGWTRDDAGDLQVTVSTAATGKALVQVPAKRNQATHRVEQLRIWPGPHGMIQLGRFTFDYTVPGR